MSRAKAQPITSEIFNKYLDTNLGVETLMTGRCPQNERGRRHAILFSDGVMIFAGKNTFINEVQNLYRLARTAGVDIADVYKAEFNQVEELYSAHSNASAFDNEEQRNIALDMLRKMISDAAQARASDIHFDVNGGTARIERRVYGEIEYMYETKAEPILTMFRAAYAAATSQDAGYSELSPQRAQLKGDLLPKNIAGVRMQFAPKPNGGRYAVFRLLEKTSQVRTLAQLGYLPEQERLLAEARRKPEGAILFVGPTGSGKTTTMASNLQQVFEDRQGRVKIISVEDPPEMEIKGVVQLAVSSSGDDDARTQAYRKILSIMLKLDPDIIATSEMSDAASANHVIQAATTGHLCWSTLHVTSPFEVPLRLQGMDVEDYNAFNPRTMGCFISQRLIPILCESCRLPITKPRDELLEATGLTEYLLDEVLELFHGEENIWLRNKDSCGSEKCFRGASGRTAIAEVVDPNAEILGLLKNNDEHGARDFWLRDQGAVTLKRHALHQVFDGLVSPVNAMESAGIFTQDDLEDYQAWRQHRETKKVSAPVVSVINKIAAEA